MADPARAIAEAVRLLKPGGRLVVADFASHDLEFLRDEHAHRRLGLSLQQITRWLQESHLALEDVATLEPDEDADHKLKVMLFLAQAA